ncbi:hypothetical protein IWQ61_008823 [Dispira simplex]|nr:hypothetical protein IWQ61_008823 [Dispira simplex]
MLTLDGSCHCGQVKFTVQSQTPVPYNCCYCSICRKLQGGGGYAINIMGIANTFKVVQGQKYTKRYQAISAKVDPVTGDTIEAGGMDRHFCTECGAYLWGWDKNYPENIYPFASAIDTPLPTPTCRTHLRLDSATSWANPRQPIYFDQAKASFFDEYPDLSVYEWHKKFGQFSE